jgi:acyl phosphate:glycerol-3-phosphate acyltransferase
VPIVVSAIIGYLLGAIPTGLLVGRWTRGVDLREHGSQRTGATNALRTLGTGAAATVFVLDVAKGIVAVIAARLLFVDDPLGEWAAATAGLAAIVGHNWSIFMRFTGGRGVATFAGALAAMSPWTVLVLAPVVALIVWRTRYVSLASIVGAVAAPGVTALFAAAELAGLAAIAFAAAAAILVVSAHADNISRLRAGTERRIGDG